MAYYTKEEIRTYIINTTSEINRNIRERGVHAAKFLVDPNGAMQNLEEEADIVGLFFLILDEDGGNQDLKLKMDGKTFLRLDTDIYCDDRFAIDQYESSKRGVTVSSIIRERRTAEKSGDNAPGSIVHEKMIEHEKEGKSES
jgi:hypothetical protein